jgi:hypothetical protein
MNVQLLKKSLKNQRIALQMLADEYEWRLRQIEGYKNELKKLDDLVVFCKTGKYPND